MAANKDKRVLAAASGGTRLFVKHADDGDPFITVTLERPYGNTVSIDMTPGQRDRLVAVLRTPAPPAEAA